MKAPLPPTASYREPPSEGMVDPSLGASSYSKVCAGPNSPSSLFPKICLLLGKYAPGIDFGIPELRERCVLKGKCDCFVVWLAVKVRVVPPRECLAMSFLSGSIRRMGVKLDGKVGRC